MSETIQVGWNTNFTMIPNELWELDFLEQEHIVVFVYLAKLGASSKGAFPSYLDLAQKCKIRNKNNALCKIRARRVVDKLISFGLLKKGNRKSKRTGKFTSNIYFLTHPQNLLTSEKSKDTEEYEITFDTPCVKSNSQNMPKDNDSKVSDNDIGCVKVETLKNIKLEEIETSENFTYTDISIKTNLYKSSSVETEEKKNDFTYLNKYKLNSKTKSVIMKNFPELTEEIFLISYNKLKSHPKIHTPEGALINDLKGEWEEFEIPNRDKKVPKNTRGDSVTIEKIEDDIKSDQKHIQEIENETNRLLEVYENLSEDLQEDILIKAKELYLKESDNKSFDSLNKRIFNSAKNALIVRVLKDKKFE